MTHPTVKAALEREIRKTIRCIAICAALVLLASYAPGWVL